MLVQAVIEAGTVTGRYRVGSVLVALHASSKVLPSEVLNTVLTINPFKVPIWDEI